MNATKNIKMPQYAAEMGKGLFVGYDDDEFATVWVCEYCGRRVRSNGCPPMGDDCPRSPLSSGGHMWS
ncbi:MAG: hypothetical protein K6B43_10220 [Treponema sp.]|nr:hypothetical protein [Treponema sp.]